MQTEPESSSTEEGRHYRDSEEAGCFGLSEGFAFSRRARREIHADEATPGDAPFICSDCLSDAVLRECVEKRRHFAHRARLTPVVGPLETDLHRGCLDEILAALKERFPEGNWAKNREIPADENRELGKVVPDLSGRISGERLVVEAQVSSLSIQQIIERSKVHTARKIPILWIIPIKADIGDTPFRPRLYERYLHEVYFGRVYYWTKGWGTMLLPVHFGLAKRFIPLSEWFDSEIKEERSAGGVEKWYKVIKRAVPAEKIDFTTAMVRYSRGEFRPWNERKTVPPLLIWRDRLQDWWEKSEEVQFRKQFTDIAIDRTENKTPRYFSSR